MQGTVPASSFSCSARRQERRLESPVCVRPGRHPSRRAFRKACFSKKRAHLTGNVRLRGNPRTTTLGPFGEVIRATGPMAKSNPFRFSTKYQDDETDFLYYGYRYYSPSTGRWLSRDPAGEDSGEFNLYGFVCNAPINDVDDLGLLTQQWIIDQVKALDASISSQTCCCDKKGISKVAETITGTHSGTVVTGTATVDVQGCVDPLIACWIGGDVLRCC